MMETGKSIKTAASNPLPPKSGALPAESPKGHVITITLKRSFWGQKLKTCRLDLSALDRPMKVDWT